MSNIRPSGRSTDSNGRVVYPNTFIEWKYGEGLTNSHTEEESVPNPNEPGVGGFKDDFDEIKAKIGIEDTLVEALYKALGCTEPLTKRIIRVVLDDISTFDRKQRDYGSGNISAFGEWGILLRCSDKLARMRNLYEKEVGPSNEAIDDSWKDLSVYGAIARVVRAGEWE